MAPRPALEKLKQRACVSEWTAEELLTFAEAAALHFPYGPFNAAALRLAGKRGELQVVRIGNRTFTTGMAISKMLTTVTAKCPPPPLKPHLPSESQAPTCGPQKWSDFLTRAIAPKRSVKLSRKSGSV
jgi:hypothetical protein